MSTQPTNKTKSVTEKAMDAALAVIEKVIAGGAASNVPTNNYLIILSSYEGGKLVRQVEKVKDTEGQDVGNFVNKKTARKFLDTNGEKLAERMVGVSVHQVDGTMVAHNFDLVAFFAAAAAKPDLKKVSELTGVSAAKPTTDTPSIEPATTNLIPSADPTVTTNTAQA